MRYLFIFLLLATPLQAQSSRAYERANENASFKRNSEVVSVPEPSTLAMLVLGGLGALAIRRKK